MNIYAYKLLHELSLLPTCFCCCLSQYVQKRNAEIAGLDIARLVNDGRHRRGGQRRSWSGRGPGVQTPPAKPEATYEIRANPMRNVLEKMGRGGVVALMFACH